MPAKFRAAEATIKWQGTDDNTPPGHSIATGTDSLGTGYLWLFKGDEPTEEAFVGSILIPTRVGQMPVAYDRGGGFAGTAADTKAALARLADRATEK
ncbi:hypothetical protein [Streptomyces sp. NPDC052701]|uniref:hypothetical protein n=1 Tax=Streptomyces sp. NPDC052701 TaxID=3155533 RepID=UPI00343A37DA